ncbi:MAG: TIGR02266 family protein [Myxococcaceae bacterium]
MANDAKPIALRIKLPFETEVEFVERYGPHVAKGGIFIATRAPRAVGTPISFELVLNSGIRLMRGEGLVHEVHQEQDRTGMMVRFTRLDARSKQLIDRIVAHRDGVVPEAPTAAPSEAAPPVSPTRALKPAAKLLADDVVLGIDLGTTTCRCALFVDGAPVLVPLKDKSFALQSVVACDPKGDLVVGAAARSVRTEHPELAVAGLKRLLGQRARSKAVAAVIDRFPFKVVADPEGDAGAELKGRTYSLTELAARLLIELKLAAQDVVERELTRAVLCVPAWYSDHQRAAMIEAGKLAGLNVLRILNEPSAVALAFGYGKGLARKRLLVYDLGGGTFDASVVEMTGDDLEVVSTGGDNFLGGVDFDQRVCETLLSTLPPDARDAIENSNVQLERIRDAAETAKIALSEQQSVEARVPFAATDGEGQPIDLHANLTRAQLEQACADLVERTAQITNVVLEVGGVKPAALDEALLVGGQTRSPMVRARLAQLLGADARTDVDPQSAVALGAAIFGHSLVQRERGKRGVTVAEVLSAPIGVAVRGGGFRRVLERNTHLPAEKTLTVPGSAGKPLELAVFQGIAPRAEENEYLGAFQTVPEKNGELSVRFQVSPDGRLEVSLAGGKKATFVTADASDDTMKKLFAAAPLPGEEAQTAGLFSGLKKLLRPSR